MWESSFISHCPLQLLALWIQTSMSLLTFLFVFNYFPQTAVSSLVSYLKLPFHLTASATRIQDLAWRPAIESGPTGNFVFPDLLFPPLSPLHFNLHIGYTCLFYTLLLKSHPLLSFLLFESLIYRTHNFVSSLIFQPVSSEMDWKTSTGIFSTISVPSCPSLPEPPDLSVPLSLHLQPPSTTQHAQPSPCAYTLPAFTRAHPPALPQIFQPSAGPGISQQIVLILYGLLSMDTLFWHICHFASKPLVSCQTSSSSIFQNR